MRACCWCINYNCISWLCRTLQRNVSGDKVWYRIYAKETCVLKQKDSLAKCSFSENAGSVGIANENFTVRFNKYTTLMREKSLAAAML